MTKFEELEAAFHLEQLARCAAEALVMGHEARIEALEIDLERQRARDPVAETITWLDKCYRQGQAVVSDECYKELVEAFISSLDPQD